MLTIHGDGTFYIPPGMKCWILYMHWPMSPDGKRKKAEQMANEAIESE